MKKKLWIRWLGVVTFLAWVWNALLYHTYLTTRDWPLRETIMIYGALSMIVAVLLTAVWAIFSLIDWTLRRQAALRAAQLAQGIGGAAPGHGPWHGAPQPAPTQASAVLACAFCRTRAAEYTCHLHRWPACTLCANQHLQADPTCSYAALAPAAAGEVKLKRSVLTSPLAGLR